MKKSELKEMLRPIVKECVKESVREIMLESGLLANVISEVVKGLNKTVLTERKEPPKFVIEDDEEEDLAASMKRKAFTNGKEIQKIRETKKHLVDSVGRQGYQGIKIGGGVNIFEGINETIPDEVEAKPGNPLSGIAPDDPGIDISNLIDPRRMSAILNGKKKEQ